ncbi:MAG: WecB/TagA/CpsF family glycosyltransferase, partial [Tepidisphaeraceae bacterium]
MYLRNGEIAWDWDVEPAPAGSTAAPSAAPVAPRSTGARPTPVARRGDDADQPPTDVREAPFPMIELHGVELHAVTERQVLDYILSELDAGRGGTVVTPNLDHLRRCTRDVTFGAMVAEADLVVADGMPLVWASRLQRTPLPQRVAGSDLISTLSAAAAGRGRSIFLLG